MDKLTLEQIMWREYDNAARDLARKGLTGAVGDALPLNMCKATVDPLDHLREAVSLKGTP